MPGDIGEHSARIRAEVTARACFRIPTDTEAMSTRHVVGLMAAAAADLGPLAGVKRVA